MKASQFIKKLVKICKDHDIDEINGVILSIVNKKGEVKSFTEHDSYQTLLALVEEGEVQKKILEILRLQIATNEIKKYQSTNEKENRGKYLG